MSSTRSLGALILSNVLGGVGVASGIAVGALLTASLGGTALAYRYVPTATGFAIDVDQLRSLVTPRTKAIIYNDLQNPISA